jgi:hypothetical protein
MSGPFRVVPFTEYFGGDPKPKSGLAIECSLRLPADTSSEVANTICEILNSDAVEAFISVGLKAPQ